MILGLKVERPAEPPALVRWWAGESPPSPTAQHNHSVFDADQCADLQSAMLTKARLLRGAASLSSRFPAQAQTQSDGCHSERAAHVLDFNALG